MGEMTVWVKSTAQMVDGFKHDLAHTPKWRILKRQQLKKNLEFWRERL